MTAAAAALAAEPRFQREVRRVMTLGERAVTELLAEIVVTSECPVQTRQRLRRYAELDPDLLHVTGADRLPQSPIRRVS